MAIEPNGGRGTVALVIEGGANRSAYATGALATLQKEGFIPDAIYDTSAGGALAAWYAAGQMERCVDVWPYAADRRVMSYRRALIGKHVFDLHALYRELYVTEFGLDVKKVQAAPMPVNVTITDADTGDTIYVDLRGKDQPTHWIHAGAALPIAAQAPVTLDGKRYLDGGTTDPIPLKKAIADGHRDIVLVLNRPKGVRKPEHAWIVKLFGRLFPNLEHAARDHHRYHNDAVALGEHPPAGVRVTIIRPSVDTGLGRTTRDVKALQRAIAAGRADAARVWATRGPS